MKENKKEKWEKECGLIICPRCDIPYEEHTCYLAKCVGCLEGHSSFHRTIVQSEEWKKWYEEQMERFSRFAKNPKDMSEIYDIDECQECGWLSKNHWNSFVKFILEQNLQDQKKEIKTKTKTKLKIILTDPDNYLRGNLKDLIKEL